MGYTIGIDFDGTVVTHEYPRVGRDIGAVPVLKRLVKCGNRLILFTMRSRQNGTLQDAVNWFEENGIKLYGVNTNPTQSEWTDSPKAHCHIYIDDAALGIPKKFDMETMRMYVDWEKVEELLEEEGAFDNYYDEEDENNVNEIKKKMKINGTQLRKIVSESIKRILSEETDNREQLIKRFYESDWETEFVDRVDTYCNEYNIWAEDDGIEFYGSGEGSCEDAIEIYMLSCKLPNGEKVDLINNY